MSLNLSRNAGAIAAAFSALVASGRAPRARLPAMRAGSLPHGTKIDVWTWHNRSKYSPHQGHRECARRRAGGFHRAHHQEIV